MSAAGPAAANVAGDLAYAAFAGELVADGILSDPWIDGLPRFTRAPVILSAAEHRALERAAEGVVAAYDEAVRLCAAEPAWLDFLGLLPLQRALWEASAPLWHGIARADAFFTSAGGVQICELNCDTPSGQPEAVVLGAWAAAAHPDLVDPSAGLRARTVGLVEILAARLPPRPTGEPLRVGIVYPTELTEDLALVALLRRWLEAAGAEVVLGSPFNLQADGSGGLGMFGRRCHVLLRHYKTDWWTEREPVWDDEEDYPDAAPLLGPLSVLAAALLEGQVAVCNPLGAVVAQNKRFMALLWRVVDRLSPDAAQAVRAHVPETFRFEDLAPERLRAERAGWVIKSDYGCEGEEVIVGAAACAEDWAEVLAHALPGRWVAQRFFDARRDALGRIANHGVYLVAGRAAGIYTRLARAGTDRTALSAPTLVAP